MPENSRASIQNLDWEAAQTANDLLASAQDYKADDVENLATKTLGVIIEQGVFATVLYLHTQTKDKSPARVFLRELFAVLARLYPGLPKPPTDQVLDQLGYLQKNVTNHLSRVLMVKQVWEQSLVYIRYGARALKKQTTTTDLPPAGEEATEGSGDH